MESYQVSSNASSVSLEISFPDEDWNSIEANYGWPALQYQTWVRGSLTIPDGGCQSVLLNACGVLEFWIDDRHYYGGDVYRFKRAKTVLRLGLGTHRVDVHLVRDVRIMGATARPGVSFELEVIAFPESLHVSEDSVLLPELVDGHLSGSLGSVLLHSNGPDPIEILSLESLNVRFEDLEDSGQSFDHFRRIISMSPCWRRAQKPYGRVKDDQCLFCCPKKKALPPH